MTTVDQTEQVIDLLRNIRELLRHIRDHDYQFVDYLKKRENENMRMQEDLLKYQLSKLEEHVDK
jgi:hypothetical protein